MIITSTRNPRILQTVRLRRRPRRDRRGQFLIEGYRSLRSAVDNHVRIDELFVCPALFLGTNEPALVGRAESAGTEVIEVAAGPFRKMSTRDRPDGLLGVAPLIRRRLDAGPPGRGGLYVIVESIEKPANLGTIIRSADAAAADGIIVCDPAADLFAPEVVRASVGAIFAIPVFEASSAEALAWCRRAGLAVVAASPHARRLYTDVDMRRRLAVAVGTEQHGLSRTWLNGADCHVKIPMLGQSDSLNVATAAALLLYEAVGQRRVEPPPSQLDNRRGFEHDPAPRA